MALTGWSGTNYLHRIAAVISARPLLIGCWGYRTASATGNLYAMFVAEADTSSNHSRSVRLDAVNNDVDAPERDISTAAATTSAAAFPDDTWTFMAATFVSATLREAYYGTGNRGANTTSVSPNTPADTIIGARNGGSNPWEGAGALAEWQAWDLTGFTQANRESLIAKLGAGENPIAIDAESGQPWTGKLVWYVPGTDTSDINDVVGTAHLTMQGTLTNFGSHPSIDSLGPDAPTISREPADIAAEEQTDTELHVRIDTVDTTPGNTTALWGHTSNLGEGVPATWEATATQIDPSVTTNDLVEWASRTPNTTYYIIAITTDGSANKAQSTVLAVTTAYARPTGLTLVSSDADSIKISATDQSGGLADHFAFVRPAGGALSALEFRGVVPAGTSPLEFEFVGLDPNTSYDVGFITSAGETPDRLSGYAFATHSTRGIVPIVYHHHQQMAAS